MAMSRESSRPCRPRLLRQVESKFDQLGLQCIPSFGTPQSLLSSMPQLYQAYKNLQDEFSSIQELVLVASLEWCREARHLRIRRQRIEVGIGVLR